MKELHETKKYSIEWMCKQLNIHRSTYYKWLKRSIPANEQEYKCQYNFVQKRSFMMYNYVPVQYN